MEQKQTHDVVFPYCKQDAAEKKESERKAQRHTRTSRSRKKCRVLVTGDEKNPVEGRSRVRRHKVLRPGGRSDKVYSGIRRKMAFSLVSSSSMATVLDFPPTEKRMNFKSYPRIYGRIQPKKRYRLDDCSAKKQNGNKIHSFSPSAVYSCVRWKAAAKKVFLSFVSLTSDKVLRVSRENKLKETFHVAHKREKTCLIIQVRRKVEFRLKCGFILLSKVHPNGEKIFSRDEKYFASTRHPKSHQNN